MRSNREGCYARRVNVLWICGAGAIGGAEHASLQTAELLHQRGHKVMALCRAGGPVGRAAAAAGLRVRQAPLGGSLNPRAWWAVQAGLAAPFDVAFVTTIHEWVWSCLAARRPPTPVVLVRHMVLPLSWRVRWLASRRAAAVVAVSEAVLQGLAGIPPDLLRVIPVASRFPPRADVPTAAERARARAALGLPEGGRWVGFFGGLDPAKGIDHVLAAIGRCGRADIHLLVGSPREDPALRARLAAQARSFGLDGRCHYLGRVAQMDVALTAADVVVLATRRVLGEAMPLTLLEAMACGTPVAAYAVGGVPEIIGSDETAGRLVRPDDADDLQRVVGELLADDAGTRRMAANALHRIGDHFAPERMAERWETLLESIVRRTSARGERR